MLVIDVCYLYLKRVFYKRSSNRWALLSKYVKLAWGSYILTRMISIRLGRDMRINLSLVRRYFATVWIRGCLSIIVLFPLSCYPVKTYVTLESYLSYGHAGLKRKWTWIFIWSMLVVFFKCLCVLIVGKNRSNRN